MTRAVRKSDRSVKGCIGALLKWSFNNAYAVDKDIIHLSGIKGTSSVKMGIPGMATAYKLIDEYYLGGDK